MGAPGRATARGVGHATAARRRLDAAFAGAAALLASAMVPAFSGRACACSAAGRGAGGLSKRSGESRRAWAWQRGPGNGGRRSGWRTECGWRGDAARAAVRARRRCGAFVVRGGGSPRGQVRSHAPPQEQRGRGGTRLCAAEQHGMAAGAAAALRGVGRGKTAPSAPAAAPRAQVHQAVGCHDPSLGVCPWPPVPGSVSPLGRACSARATSLRTRGGARPPAHQGRGRWRAQAAAPQRAQHAPSMREARPGPQPRRVPRPQPMSTTKAPVPSLSARFSVPDGLRLSQIAFARAASPRRA